MRTQAICLRIDGSDISRQRKVPGRAGGSNGLGSNSAPSSVNSVECLQVKRTPLRLELHSHSNHWKVSTARTFGNGSIHPRRHPSLSPTYQTFYSTMGKLSTLALSTLASLALASPECPEGFTYHGCAVVDLYSLGNPLVFSDSALTPEACQKACESHSVAALFPELVNPGSPTLSVG
ncbi:hypothetical protein LIA77_04906 [Sarocladium implicatum]|nr:hypothetical protein LIA77_04906 [Sarocladium implicatum]